MINIISGKFKSGKTTRILQIIKEELKNKRMPLLIVPSRNQRDHFVKLISEEICFAGKLVYTLGEAIQETAAASREKLLTISDFEAYIILKLIIEENKNKFQYFKNLSSDSGLVRLIYSLVMELRAGNLMAMEKNNRAGFTAERKNPDGSKKWQDIFFILDEYEKRLNEKDLYDSHRLILKAAEIVNDNDIFKRTVLAIDGFFDFTAVQFEFVKSLVHNFEKNNKNIFITCLDTGDSAAEKNRNRFWGNFKAEWIGMERGWEDGQPAEVETITAFGKYREVEQIANKVKKLILENDYHYNDIGIIVRNPDEYAPIIRQVFQDYQIPYYNTKDEQLKLNPAVIFIYTIIRIALRDRAIDNIEILGIVNSNYMNAEKYRELSEILDIFPFYFRGDSTGWKEFTGNQLKYYSELRAGKILDEDESSLSLDDINLKYEKVSRLNKPLEEFLGLIFGLQNGISMDDFLRWLAGVMEDLEMRKCLASGTKDGLLSAKDYTAFRKLNEALFSLKKALKVFGKETFDREELFYLFDNLIQDVNYRYQFYPVEAVKVLTPFDARESNFRAVFIPGLNEGEFPGALKLSLFENHERKRLNRFAKRVILEDEENRNEAEKLDFKLVLSRAGEKVYLSYTPFCESGKEVLPSLYLLQVLKKAGIYETEKLKWEKKGSSLDDILPSVSEIYDIPYLLAKEWQALPPEDKKEVLKKYPHLQNPDKMKNYHDQIFRVNKYYTGAGQTDGENSPVNDGGTKFFGRLDNDQNAPEDLANREWVNRKTEGAYWSSSRMEKFGNCRYQFFIQYILEIRDEKYPSQEIEAAWKGLFYHAVLRDYIEKTKDISGPEILLDMEKYTGILDGSIDKTARDMMQNESGDNLFQMEKEYYRRVLHRFAEFDARELRSFGPAHFEYPIDTVLTAGENTFQVKGSIDRVDSAENGGENKTFRIMDYKSGSVRHFKEDYQIPLKLFQGFIYAKAFGGAVNEISYVSIEKGEKTDVLPYKTGWNRKTGEYDIIKDRFHEIWGQKEKEIQAIMDLIKKGDFSPFTSLSDYPPPLLEFYEGISKEGQVKAAESENKCGYCPYTDACLRTEKLIREYF